MLLFFKPNADFLVPAGKDIVKVSSLADILSKLSNTDSYDHTVTLQAYRRLSENNALFSRWQDDLSKFNLSLSTLAFDVARVVQFLNEKSIKVVVFNTSVYHHLEATILTIACEIKRVRQLFLYCSVVGGGVLPVVHDCNINNRKVVDHGLGDSEANRIRLDEFIAQFTKKQPPKINTPITDRRKSFWVGSAIVAKISIIRSLVAIKNRGLKVPLWSEHWSLASEVKCMFRQRSALKYYYELATTFDNDERPQFVIAAHFQPEATSFPEGGEYFNHGFIVDKIYESVGRNCKISYKEHPASVLVFDEMSRLTRVGNQRSVEYYSALTNRGVSFLKFDENLIDMVKEHGVFPVTISGTVALELCLSGYQVVVAGLPWFKGLPGTITLDDLGSIDFTSVLNNQSEKIAQQSKQWLANKLLKNQLDNPLGIGLPRFGDKEKFAAQIVKISRDIAADA